MCEKRDYEERGKEMKIEFKYKNFILKIKFKYTKFIC